jgi:hypothetical protein
MSSLLQNLLIIGGIILLLAFGYYIYTQNTGLSVSSDSAVSAQVAVETADFLRRLNELKAIQLNGEIFSDPRFVSLVNYTVPVTSEAVGRTNPFDVSNN